MANILRHGIVSGLLAFSCLASTAWIVSSAHAGDANSRRAPGERELEGRLIAPCCWTQTLDIHDSPIAEELRGEIHRRLSAGEPSLSIEDDLALRYGAKIRAVPRGRDPRATLPFVLSMAMALSVLGLVWAGRKWLRRSGPTAHDPPAEPTLKTADGVEYDARLDEELKRSSE